MQMPFIIKSILEVKGEACKKEVLRLVFLSNGNIKANTQNLNIQIVVLCLFVLPMLKKVGLIESISSSINVITF